MPAAFDLSEQCLKNVTLTLIATSVTNMLRSSVILFTAVLARLFLKRKLHFRHFAGLLGIILGISMVGLSQMEQSREARSSYIGILILLTGQLASASGLVVEEKYLSGEPDLDPFFMAGVQGMWQTLISVCVLAVLQVVPCSDEDLCPHGVVEDSIGALAEYGKQPLHFLWTGLLLVFICFFAACGLTITKLASAAARTTVESLRSVVIWIFFMSVPINGQRLEIFKWLQLIGFITLVTGVLVYNEIIQLKRCK